MISKNFCDRCYAPVRVENEEGNVSWYACQHCGYGQAVIGNQVIEVTPDNLPKVYQ